MALLTTPYDPTATARVLIAAMEAGQQRQQANAKLLTEQLVEQRRQQAHESEFARQLAFNEAKEAEEARRWNFENEIIGGSPSSSLPGETQITQYGVTPAPAPAVPAPLEVSPPSEGLTNPFIETPTGPQTVIAPTPPAVPADSSPSSDLPANPSLPGEDMNLMAGLDTQVAGLAKGLRDSGSLTRKGYTQALNAGAAALASRRPARSSAGAASESVMSQWPINELGYRFNPSNPEQQFMERVTPKGTTYSQVKKTDPFYGLKAVGDGVYEDQNGGQYFTETIANGKPTLKRVEEDDKVAERSTDQQGRIHSWNRFGREVSVTDEKFNFLTPKSTLKVGTDGQVYAFAADSKPLQPLPADVRFDGKVNEEAKLFRMGSDGKMYAFNWEGKPLNPHPEGLTFTRPKDPESAAKWEVNKKTGNLEVFNYKGDKIAENEGDFASLKEGAINRHGTTTMTNDAMYQTMKPAVQSLHAVYDRIKAAGLDPHTSHEELVRALGEQGALLSKQRGDAGKAVNTLKINGRAVGSNFAEGFVKAYEERKAGAASATAPASPAAPAGSPAAPAAASAPATPKAGNSWKIDKSTGIKWEVDADGKLTGAYVKPEAKASSP